MKTGADEIILNLRKLGFGLNVPNNTIGKRIRKLMKDFGGTLFNKNVRVIYPVGDKTKVNKLALPKTAAQYEIDYSMIGIIYENIKSIKSK